MAASATISLHKGNSRNVYITCLDEDGVTPLPLTGAHIQFDVLRNSNDTTPIITKKNTVAGGNTNQIEVLNEAEGRVKVKLVPSDTSSATRKAQTYRWRFKVSWPMQDRAYTMGHGTFSLLDT